MKDVKVTRDFLGLDETVRGCEQAEGLEDIEDCRAAKYLDNILAVCGCVPLQFRWFVPGEVSQTVTRRRRHSQCEPPGGGL